MEDNHEGQNNVTQTGNKPYVFIRSTQQEHAPNSETVGEHHPYYKYDKSEKWRNLKPQDRYMVLLTLGILLIAGITAWILLGQFNTMSDQTQVLTDQAYGDAISATLSAVQVQKQLRLAQQQADAATSASTTARDSLIRSNRPWVGIDGSPYVTEPVQMSIENGDRRADLKIRFIIKNFGTSPALHVGMGVMNEDAPFKGVPEFFESQKLDVDAACRMADMETLPTRSQTLTPKGMVTLPPSQFGPYIFPQNILPHLENIGIPELSKRVDQLRFIGCIAYQDQFSITHHSTFCFRGNGQITNASPNTQFSVCGINQTAN